MQFSYGTRYIFYVISPDSLSSPPSQPGSTARLRPSALGHRVRLLLPSLALGLATWLAVPHTGHADEAMEAARKRYEVGERHYIEGRYWQAGKAFEEAYNLSKRGDLLFNAGRAYDKGEYAVRAIESYQGYLNAFPDAPDRGAIEKRLKELSASLAKLTIVTDEKAFILIDGHEIGRTPTQTPIDMDSGYHRLTVRRDNRSWSKEQQFNAGDTYRFEVTLADSKNDAGGLDSGTEEENSRLRTPPRRFAAVLGGGAAVDVAGGGFPPHQAALTIGLDYRARLRSNYAVDIMMRVPFELAGGWRNAGFVLGLRGAIFPTARLPLEIYFELGAGLGVLESSVKTLPGGKGACSTAAALNPCSLYGVRINPAVGIAYRIVSAFEVRAELLGVDVNLTSPIVDPRLRFMAAVAYRFL